MNFPGRDFPVWINLGMKSRRGKGADVSFPARSQCRSREFLHVEYPALGAASIPLGAAPGSMGKVPFLGPPVSGSRGRLTPELLLRPNPRILLPICSYLGGDLWHSRGIPSFFSFSSGIPGVPRSGGAERSQHPTSHPRSGFPAAPIPSLGAKPRDGVQGKIWDGRKEV